MSLNYIHRVGIHWCSHSHLIRQLKRISVSLLRYMWRDLSIPLIKCLGNLTHCQNLIALGFCRADGSARRRRDPAVALKPQPP